MDGNIKLNAAVISCASKDSYKDDFYFNGNFSNCLNTESIQCSFEKYSNNFIFAVSDSMGIDDGDTNGISAIKEIKKYHENIKRQQYSLEYIAEKISESVQLTSNLIYSKSAVLHNQDSSVLTGFSSIIVDNNRAVVMNLGNNGVFLYRQGERYDVFARNDSRKTQKLKMLGITPNSADIYNDTEKILKLAEEESKTKVKASPTIEIEEDDIFLICSDGLLNSVSKSRIEAVVNSGLDCSKMASILFQEALKNGIEDSITIMIIKVDKILNIEYPSNNYRRLSQDDYYNESVDDYSHKEKNIVNYILAFVCVVVISGVLFMAYLIIQNSNILASDKEPADSTVSSITADNTNAAENTDEFLDDLGDIEASDSTTLSSSDNEETDSSKQNNDADGANQNTGTQANNKNNTTDKKPNNETQTGKNNAADSGKENTESNNNSENTEYDIHVVQPGETLSSISNKYYGNSNKYDAIIKFNNLKDANSLYVNQELKIPKLN
ncbi:LysM peptidoglycan-binding domain-containing protein [Ruminiclostridium herbifermentans]|uniref:LysM peptidoglycan-binding domain-containing protein n=1 Tax=Ruminiclostridium herbifermentans TaxID=2488810 RepID=A0A4V6EP87_9FIRM|nr:LysM peptidoglycan-binding domain-containing protein [Ruminiclostridium herbifermentans]QNU68260.1 LysM peptidoglycan-binding domain-containing protein [Ruminiclostridium herbifermentans]